MSIQWEMSEPMNIAEAMRSAENTYFKTLNNAMTRIMEVVSDLKSSEVKMNMFLEKSTDSSLTNKILPHPARCNFINHEAICALSLSPQIIYNTKLCALAGVPIPESVKVCQYDKNDSKALQRLKNHANDGESAVNSGQLITALTPVYQSALNSPTFVFTTELVKELDLTDINKGVMADMFQPPYESMYAVFGDEGYLSSHTVYNNQTGDHELEGVYINITSKPRRPFGDGVEILGLHSKSELMCIDLMFVGTPKTNIMDDATQNASLFFDLNSDITLTEQIDNNLEYYAKMHTFRKSKVEEQDTSNYIPMSEVQVNNMRKNLTLLVKCLVYLNCADVRKESIDNRSSLEKKLKGLKNPKKLKRVKQELDRIYSYTLISGTKPEPSLSDNLGNGSNVKPHWRRGFLRIQRHGKGRTLTKLIHIKPTLVNKSQLGKAETSQKIYKVK